MKPEEAIHARRLLHHLEQSRMHLRQLLLLPAVCPSMERWERFNTEAVFLESRLQELLAEEDRKGGSQP